MDNIFPEEIINYTSENHYHKNRVKGTPLYNVVLLLILSIVIAVPFLKVDITFSSRGMLRTVEEPGNVVVPREGIIIFNALHKNRYVENGDTLIVVDHSSLLKEYTDNQTSMDMISGYIHDLEIILSGKGAPLSERYCKMKLEYENELNGLNSECIYLKDEFLTAKGLFEQGFIARMEFESIKRKYNVNESKKKSRQNQYFNQWQAELSNYKMEYLKLRSRSVQLKKLIDMHIVKAPVSGTITDYKEIRNGSYIPAQEIIARIVPDTKLIASCIIPPDKISRIYSGQQVRLRIDAFPGHDFGRIHGKVTLIPDDVSTFSNTTGYPVLCDIEQTFRQSDVVDAHLKSGMTFTALFILSRKTILQVLLEKGEELLLPDSRN